MIFSALAVWFVRHQGCDLLFKKIYDKESGKGLLCRTSEDESQQIYSFDKGYRCFSGKAPFIESEKIFREILSALEKEKMQAAHIDRVLDLNPEKVKQCMDAGLLQYRKRANEAVHAMLAVLTDKQRDLIHQQFVLGKTHQEIADDMGISRGSVTRAVNQALERIRRKFDFEAHYELAAGGLT